MNKCMDCGARDHDACIKNWAEPPQPPCWQGHTCGECAWMTEITTQNRNGIRRTEWVCRGNGTVYAGPDDPKEPVRPCWPWINLEWPVCPAFVPSSPAVVPEYPKECPNCKTGLMVRGPRMVIEAYCKNCSYEYKEILADAPAVATLPEDVLEFMREVSNQPWQDGAPCMDLVCDAKALLAKYKGAV